MLTRSTELQSVQAGIDRYRDLSKYLVTIFAAIGAVLVAGAQLSSLGALSWDADRTRILIAGAGFLLAIGAVIWVIHSALTVLQPVEISLDDVVEDDDLRANAETLPGALGGLNSVEELRDLLEGPFGEDEVCQEWNEVASSLVARSAFCLVRSRFERAWKRMLVGALIGTVGIVAFACAANPDEEPSSDPAPRSMLVTVLRPAG